MAEFFPLDEENFNKSVQDILNLIGNQLVLYSSKKSRYTKIPISQNLSELHFKHDGIEYIMLFDRSTGNYISLHRIEVK